MPLPPIMAALYGTSAALGAGQVLSSAYKTEEEKQNLKRLEQVRDRLAADNYYDAQKAEQVARTTGSAARTQAAQRESDYERINAAQGTSDASSIQRARESMAREAGIDVQRAAAGGFAAGMQGGEARRAADVAEETGRTQAAGGFRSDRAGRGGAGVAQMAQTAGQMAGSMEEIHAADAFGGGLKDKAGIERETAALAREAPGAAPTPPLMGPLTVTPGAAPAPAPTGTDRDYLKEPRDAGLARQVLDENRSVPFIQRMLDMGLNPKETHPEHPNSTHLLSTAADDVGTYVYPALQAQGDQYVFDSGPRSAVEKGNIVRFPTAEEAHRFAEGSWKPVVGVQRPSFQGVRPTPANAYEGLGLAANSKEGWMRRALIEYGIDPDMVKVLTDKELLELYAEATR